MTANCAEPGTDANHPSEWLGSTRLLDLEDSRLRLHAMRITQLATSDLQKATLVHDYIKLLPFGCVAGFDAVPAADVLKRGRGDCHTKGTLFVALLRCAGIPARLRFVSLNGAFLHGIIDIGQSTIIHALGEVYLNERWVQTDTYVTDSLLEVQASHLLQHERRSAGYGIHVSGQRFWDGLQHAHAQYAASDAASLPTHDWGVAHDPEGFYSNQANPHLRLGWLARAKWIVAAQVVNRRTQTLRDRAASA